MDSHLLQYKFYEEQASIDISICSSFTYIKYWCFFIQQRHQSLNERWHYCYWWFHGMCCRYSPITWGHISVYIVTLWELGSIEKLWDWQSETDRSYLLFEKGRLWDKWPECFSSQSLYSDGQRRKNLASLSTPVSNVIHHNVQFTQNRDVIPIT